MIKEWIAAFRLRTLPLSLSCVGMGAFLASMNGLFDGLIFTLTISTTVFLQVLSNLANDYGDTQNGADSKDRVGPSRSVQSGAITKKSMMKAIIILGLLSFISGLALIAVSFGWFTHDFNIFLAIGVLAIVAAIKYTMGSKPYGYAGLGDISVLLFFGVVGVGGTFYLFTQAFHVAVLFPALACGFLATGVLNINNIRDIKSDKAAGKLSIPVRIGIEKAVVYHWMLLVASVYFITYFTISYYFHYFQFLYLLSIPLMIFNGMEVSKRRSSKSIDPLLKQLALTTLLFVVLFGSGQLLAIHFS